MAEAPALPEGYEDKLKRVSPGTFLYWNPGANRWLMCRNVKRTMPKAQNGPILVPPQYAEYAEVDDVVVLWTCETATGEFRQPDERDFERLYASDVQRIGAKRYVEQIEAEEAQRKASKEREREDVRAERRDAVTTQLRIAHNVPTIRPGLSFDTDGKAKK